MSNKSNVKQVLITLSASGISEFLDAISDKYKGTLLLRLKKWESEKLTENDRNLENANREWKKRKGFKFSVKYYRLIAPKISDPDYGFGICQKVIEKKGEDEWFIDKGFLRIQTVFGPNFDAYSTQLLGSELEEAKIIDQEIREMFDEREEI